LRCPVTLSSQKGDSYGQTQMDRGTEVCDSTAGHQGRNDSCAALQGSRYQPGAGAKQRLNGKRAQNGTPEKAKIRELERIIGKQTVTIEILKKNQQMEKE